jgi:hypothetical protein
MPTVRIVVWQEEGGYLGYLQDYPDYWTQGETFDDLKEHLVDLYRDVTSGELPGIRKVDDLDVS